MDENQGESSRNQEMESDDVSENQQENLESTSRQSSTDQQRSAASRTRRLVSQSTFQENDLDNPELNSQRQFLDISSSNSSIDSECDDDEMFEEYLRQRTEAAQTQATPFDDELPMHHSYLGENMDIVRGTTIFEAGKIYELPICAHHTMVFPGEILPMILISESLFGRSNADSDGGLIFGCVFPDEMLNKKIYGVTCQVFERGIDNNGHITVKSKARQRFMLVKTEEGYTTMRNNNHYAKVKILPEYLLPDPISLTITNNSKKFLQTPSYQQKLKNLLASSTQIPRWIYDRYSIVHTNDKVERFLAMLALSSPQDPILKSFWLARNVPLNPTDRMKIFASNCVNHRMIMIGDSLNFMCYFKCKRCNNSIACYGDIFAMAKGNVNANYCNPAGYIHETLTVQKTIENALQMVDRPSTDFSWFPGYSWQIAICSKCSTHVGWKFSAVVKNLKPKTFYGLSNKSLIVWPDNMEENNEDYDDQDDGENSMNVSIVLRTDDN